MRSECQTSPNSSASSMGLLLEKEHITSPIRIIYILYAQQHNVNPDNAQHCNDMQ